MWWQYPIVGATAPDPETTELNAMLIVSSKSFRIRAAVAVTLLYAVCILAPSAAFAFAAPDAAAHCLTEPLGAAHVHQEKAAANSGIQADGGTHVANTREVGGIRVTGYESKGRINKRIRIELVDPVADA